MRIAPPLFLSVVLATAVPARANPPSIESGAPSIGQRGSEFELKLTGAGLANAADLLFYLRGITVVGIEPVSDNEAKVRLRAASDCRLGTHAYRVRNSHGLSEMRTLRVTPFRVVAAEEPNESTADAQPVEANVTVAGSLESGDVDHFRLNLRRGDRLAAEVEAIRLAGRLLDTVLTVFGPDGKVLARSDDTALFRQDPLVTLVAPADGDYVIQVHEVNYEGDEQNRYALHVGTFPRPTFVYPAGGPAGQQLTVRFGGDAAGEFERQISLPGHAGSDFGLYPTAKDTTAPTANPFRVSPFGNVLETEPNDDGPAAGQTPAELPVAFNGVLQRPADVDCFRFRAAAGDRRQFEVYSSRLGLPADTLISISDSGGREIVSNDDDATHDSRLVFQAPQAGEYVLSVRDKRGGGGEGFVYRVEATAPEPGVAVFLPRPIRTSQEQQTVVVPRGNRVLARLGVQRRGIEGEARVKAVGMPAGVTFPETTVPDDQFWAPIVIEAQADAPLGGGLAWLQATVTAEGREASGGFVQVVDLVGGPADAIFESVEVDRMAVTVADEVPFRVTIDSPRAALSQDGTIGLVIHVDRKADFDGPVEVSIPFLPRWSDGPASITIPAEQSSAVYTVHAFPQADTRAWPLVAEARSGRPVAGRGRAPRRGGRPSRASGTPGEPPPIAVASNPIMLPVTEPPVAGTIGAVAAEQGQTLKVVCTLQRRGPVPEKMTATLEGLPNRVAASPVVVSAEDARVTFEVKLEPTAPVGAFPSLVCRLAGVLEGQVVSYATARGAVLKIARGGGLVADEAGRPLSPLEVLRKTQKPVKAGETGRAADPKSDSRR